MSDFLVLGGGIAGASAGYFLAGHGKVTLIEREDTPGYHSTGRSAALFSEYYGNRIVRALTAASRPFFDRPPSGFAEHPLLTPRGVIALAPIGEEARFETILADGQSTVAGAREIGLEQVRQFCPVVKPGWYSRAMYKPGAQDIDVAALHQGFLRGIRARKGMIVTRASTYVLKWRAGLWHIATAAGDFSAPVLINAAGAWADEVAGLADVKPIGLVPKRRSAFIIDPPQQMEAAAWPMITDVVESFYFKPEAGKILVSPADATPVTPCDAQPEELDIAIGAARIEEVTTLKIHHISHKWAGLRSFVRDDTPVIGEAVDATDFFWLAGLGGYGIQIAPCIGQAVAAMVTGTALFPDMARPGFEVKDLSPARLF
jgi:D-arginine dehydrogenase